MKLKVKKLLCLILSVIVFTANISTMTLFANNDIASPYDATYPPGFKNLDINTYMDISPSAVFEADDYGLDGAINATTYVADVYSLASGSYTFSFTGGMQSITLPPGNYTLEVWGAQGGTETAEGFTSIGGRGGYSRGEIAFTTERTLYIGVGGEGGSNSHPVGTTVASGGFNGGGNGNPARSTGSGGGGATHIATAQGVLSGLNNNRSAVLIVAGGGGGGDAFYGYGRSAPGGAGGGLEGGSNGTPGSGGTQIAGGVGSSNGIFGQGGNRPHGGLAGGGGGWFGGAAGFYLSASGNNTENGNIGAGGSGYIGGVTNGTTINDVREGHGMARITLTGAGTDDSLLNPEEKDYDGELPRDEGDPIDVVTGIFTWEYTNLELHGAQNLTFSTHYASNLKCGTSIGTGWRHSFDYRLIVDAEQAQLHLPNGNTHDFTHNSGIFVAQANSDVLLSATTNGYRYTDFDMTHYDFDSIGNLVKIQDIRGNTTILTHEDDKLSQVSNRAGIMNFEYNEFNISKITDHTGRSVSFTYNPAGQLVAFENADGYTLDFKYNTEHSLTEINDFNGKTFLINVYQNGKVIEQTLLDQGTMHFEYSPETYSTTFTDALGNKKVYHYDENSKITRIVDSDGETSQVFENGRLISVTDYMGYTTSYEYDDVGNRTAIIFPDGLRESLVYNDKRQVTQVTYRDGSKNNYNYDNRGNLLSAVTVPTQGQNRVRSYTYSSNNDLLTYTDATGAITSFTYDDKGNRLSMTDATSRTTFYTYDNLGRMKTQKSPMGEVTEFRYTQAGDLISIIYPDGNEFFDVNKNGYNVKLVDPMGFITMVTYDGMNNPLTVTDPVGGKVFYEYDEVGNLTKITDAMNATSAFAYDSKGRLISTTNRNGNKWIFNYDANGKLTETIAPDNGISSIEYNIMGNPTSISNAKNATTVFTYDNLGRVTIITDALGGSNSYQYDGFGNVKSITDPNGNLWHYNFDDEDRLLESIDPLGGKTNFTYDATGRLIGTVSPAGVVYSYRYNRNGYLENVIDSLGNAFTNTYDYMGRLAFRNNPDGTSVSFQYDINGRLAKAIDENGNFVLYDYDKNGNVVTVTDAEKNVTRFAYDKNNRLITATDALGGNASYTYDVNSNIKSLTDANGNRTEWVYDNMNRPIEEQRIGFGVRRFSYNEVGELTSITNGRGAVLSFSYDNNGRLTSGAGINYTYDKNGNALTVSNQNGMITREYDALNRVKVFTDVKGNIIKYNYDADGRIKTLTYPGGEVVTYSYNQAGQLTDVTDYNNRVTSYQYDANGRLIHTIMPDGSIETKTYDNAGRIVSKRTVNSNIIINDYRYDYDKNGNIVRETNDIIGQDIVLSEGISTMSYDSGNRLAEYNGQSVIYDGDGNMAFGPLGNDFISFAYDSLNTLLQCGDVTYDYDGEGRRISQNISGQTISYVVDPSSELSRLLVTNHPDGSNTIYVYGLGLISQEQVSQSGQKNDYRLFHYDFRGSTTALTDVNGDVTGRVYYNSFGKIISQTGNTNTIFLYMGQYGGQTDSNGLYYLRARYYNPLIMRFINQDPIRDGMNWYMYVDNNPISRIDPWGLISYVLWDPNTHSFNTSYHVNDMISKLEDLYGTEAKIVKTIGWKAEDFESWWNQLSGDIDAIVIFGHGRDDRIRFDHDKDVGRRGLNGVTEETDYGMTVDQMNNLLQLKNHDVSMMVILNCNTGSGENNIATTFAKYISGSVFAPTGTTTDSPRFLLWGGKTSVSSGNLHFARFQQHADGSFSRNNIAVRAIDYEKTSHYIAMMHRLR